jgi:hypothetical protein
METIKKIVYVLLGILANGTLPVLIFHNAKFEGVLGVIAIASMLTIVPILQAGLFFLVEKMVDESSNPGKIFPMFWWMFIRQRKKTYHSKLGWFDLYIFRSANKIFVYKQGFFHCFEIGEVSLGHSDVPGQIKELLDREYSSTIKEKDEREKQNELIAKVRQWDGFLDKETRRDKKINDLGI